MNCCKNFFNIIFIFSGLLIIMLVDSCKTQSISTEPTSSIEIIKDTLSLTDYVDVMPAKYEGHLYNVFRDANTGNIVSVEHVSECNACIEIFE